jgi:hypothetical protein
MSYLMVPTRVSAGTASVWVGTIDEAERPTVFANGLAVPAPAWQRLAGGPHTLVYGRVDLAGLPPRTRCDLELRVGDRTMAVGGVTTLPDRLPTATARPFTVMLGSCFHVANDRGVGRAYLGVPAPDIKILCGDQVYLDAPASHFFVHTHSQAEMERMFFEAYQRTWEQADADNGFRRLLQDGANYLSADDHEFWNNAPTFASYARDTWTAKGRATWWKVASDLYAAFQDDRTIEQFSVGDLSFLIADTRLHRDSDRRQLMQPAEWTTVCDWVGALRGPGVLVVGQPLFSTQGGVIDRFKDWSLADFEQYRQLAAALIQSRHSVVILTGDVHFGRVATCALPASAGATTPRLIEVISSPLALVDSRASGNWRPAPDQFPAFAIPGLGRFPVTTITSFRMQQDHFLTIELTGVTGGARLAVRSWPVVPDAAQTPGQQVFEDTIY